MQGVNAIDFTDTTLWQQVTSDGIENVAVNTTITEQGALGAVGVVNTATSSTTDGDLEPDGASICPAGQTVLDRQLFAEAAVNINTFTGGNNCAGSVFYGSVITRASGSPTRTHGASTAAPSRAAQARRTPARSSVRTRV